MKPALRLILALIVLWALPAWSGGQAPRMDVATLSKMLAEAQVVVIDVRQSKHWAGSAQKIKGAVRHNPGGNGSWIKDQDRTKTYVLYCA